jgi:hypothetical protein
VSASDNQPAKIPKNRLEIALTSRALGVSLADNALAQPFGLEAALKNLELIDGILAALDEGVLGGHGAVGGDAEVEGGEERVRDLVSGEGDLWVLEETLREHVGEGVVFLVEPEDESVRDLCCCGDMLAGRGRKRRKM